MKYFTDTDTTLLEFSTSPPVETREVNENIYVGLDSKGRVVSMTIEHAGQSADMNEFLFQRIPTDTSAERSIDDDNNVRTRSCFAHVSEFFVFDGQNSGIGADIST